MNIEFATIPMDKYTRPGLELGTVKAIVMHWFANPGQSPQGVINFWKSRENVYGSAHDLIGLDGKVYSAIPHTEVAYHCGHHTYTPFARKLFGAQATSNSGFRCTPNHYTIGIEMAHIDWEGTFTEETLESAATRCAEICLEHDLDPFQHIITHNMVVGYKNCPKRWVDNPADLELFRIVVEERM